MFKLFGGRNKSKLPGNPNDKVVFEEEKMKEIWLAGGCFWGVEAYFSRIYGVGYTTVGYANGKTTTPSYHEIATTGHKEAVHIKYDPAKVSLSQLLKHFFKIIDPTIKNRQGNDIGTQYQTGIYYREENDLNIIRDTLTQEQLKYQKPIVVEVATLENYYLAEEYHQKYLEKNPRGYCHVDFSTLAEQSLAKGESKSTNQTLKSQLTDVQYRVTQENATEPPFRNEYWNNKNKGIYVDIISGEPLFLSSDKFDSGCGWPSFSRPVSDTELIEKVDTSHGVDRTEVRSNTSHLGHVFDDGPKESGGLRYCINSAALRFIPVEEMEQEGYGSYIQYLNS